MGCRFEIPECPKCGDEPEGTVDTIPGVALMSRDEESGTFEFDGETKVWWDGQETPTNEDGRVEVQCSGCGDSWFSAMWWESEKGERPAWVAAQIAAEEREDDDEADHDGDDASPEIPPRP